MEDTEKKLNSTDKEKLGHQHQNDPSVFVDHENLGVKTKTRSGKTLKLDRDVFSDSKWVEKKLQESENEEEGKRSTWKSIAMFFLELIVILLIVVGIRSLLASPFEIEGSSMENTLHDGEKIFIEKVSTYSNNFERGDIIVFKPPYYKMMNRGGPICFLKKIPLKVQGRDTQQACQEPQYYVKRIIGIPGDTVEIKGGKVFLTPPNTGKAELQESYLSDKNKGNTCFNRTCSSAHDRDGYTFVVPEGKVFVLGDNRTRSTDSRAALNKGTSFNQGSPEPFIPFENIEGTVKVLIWPMSRWQWFSEGE